MRDSWAEFFGVTHATDDEQPNHRACLIAFYGVLALLASLLWYGAGTGA